MRLIASLLFVAALAGCGVVETAADVTATAVGTAADVAATAVTTTTDVATAPIRSGDADDADR
ncbi:MAG: hypothetical protein IRY94_08360 [Rhodospirillaceae bacterium]|nr:hypothetical protein [Rhodospirillaceae bacterium]